jgi:hypothetical protein
MDDKLFTEEKSLFQKKINNILKENPVKDVIEDLIKLHYLRTASKNESKLVLVEIYNLLGSELFAELIELINGRPVQFPDSDSFKESVNIALCYYFKYLKHKKWDEIKTLLQDEDVSSIKYGINCNKLHCFINELSTITDLDSSNSKEN